MDFGEFVKKLDEEGKLVHIKKPVSVKFEIPTIMKKMDGKPLIFENVQGYEYPVVANICSTRELVSIGLGCQKNELMNKLAGSIDNPKEPAEVESDYHEIDVDLEKLPILTYYPEDGGPYIASAVVVVNDAEYGINSSYHRLMVIGKDEFAARILPRHFEEYAKRGNKEFAICVGNSIPVLLGSAVSCEIGKSELSIANALGETKIVNLDGHKVPQSDIVMIAEFADRESQEGPFLDLTETPDIVRQQPVIKVKKIFVRPNAMFHALLPGGLEHKVLMGMPREPTIFREVSKVTECKDVSITPGGCSWLHGVVSIKKKFPEDGRVAIEAAMKGHASMKHVFIVDEDIDVHDPHEVEWAMATRFQGHKDMLIKKDKGSSLDPSSDLETRETTKIGFDLTIPGDKDARHFRKPKLPMDINVDDYLEE
jgi:UbiD family decarboxylase